MFKTPSNAFVVANIRPIAVCDVCGREHPADCMIKAAFNLDNPDSGIRRAIRDASLSALLPVGWVSSGTAGICCSNCK
jgi:hypothetical protein